MNSLQFMHEMEIQNLKLLKDNFTNADIAL